MDSTAPHLRIGQLSVEVFDRWIHMPQIAGGCHISTDTATQDQHDAIDAAWDVVNGKLTEVHISVDGLFALCLDEMGYLFKEYTWQGAEGENPQPCTLESSTHSCSAGTFVLTYEENDGKIIVHSAGGIPAKCA